ncbi:MAG TPA: sulfite exporter TauE/SafE family protein [Pseudomonadales bacterium]|nr:sulfite exporter TauE/SafE family protein [Pseudomonadales bacterium]
MDLSLLAFVLLVAVGGYVQSVAGFAMGMILIAGSSALHLFPLPITAAVISLVSLLNIVLSLTGHLHRVHRRGFGWMLVGQVPMIAVGVWLLTWLDASSERFLRMLLGGFILAGCAVMMVRPEPRARESSSPAFLVAGMGGGMLGGLFSAAAPAMGWFVYMQPLMVAEIRATLLACFAVSTIVRTLVVGVGGGLTSEVWILAAWSVPMVLLSAWLGRRFAPPVSEQAMRRGAFALLFAMGGWILVSALLEGP